MSKIVAIMPVRNEAWICGLSIRALLLWCDEVVIFNHISTDRTLHILHEIQQEDKRLIYFSGTDENWAEMQHRQRLLECARERGATHIVTIDADEVLTGSLLPSIREMILNVPTGRILQLPWIQLRGGIDRFISSGMWANNHASCAFMDRPEWHWKAQPGGYQHHHRHPMGLPMVPWPWSGPTIPSLTGGGLLHLQMASSRRLRSKQALYLMRETLLWPGRKTAAQLNTMYGPTVHTGAAKDLPVPEEWWTPYDSLINKYLDLDAEPWQEAEVKRLWEEHGAAKFQGLDLYEVIG